MCGNCHGKAVKIKLKHLENRIFCVIFFLLYMDC